MAIIKLKDNPYKNRNLEDAEVPEPVIRWGTVGDENLISGNDETFKTNPLTWNAINYWQNRS